MGKGFLAGVIWGALVGALGLALASVLAPMPGARTAPTMTPTAISPEPVIEAPAVEVPTPESPALQEPSAPEAAPVQPNAPLAAPDATPSVTPSVAPVTDAPMQFAPVPDTESPLPVPAEKLAPAPLTAPDAAPAVQIEPEPAAPAQVTPEPSVEPAAEPANKLTTEPTATPEATVVEVPAGSEFNRPLPEVDPYVPGAETAPKAEPAPDFEAPAPAPAQAPADTASAAHPTPDTALSEAPGAPVVEFTAPLRPSAVPDAAPAGTKAATPSAPLAETAPGAAQLPPPPPLEPADVAEAAKALGLPAPDQPAEPAPAVKTPAPAEVETAVAPVRPQPGLTGAVPGITTDRLPRIGDAAPEPAPAATPEPDLPAYIRFARAFESPEGKPLFAILLVDTGGAGLDREALAALPFPVSFVIDPMAPDAAIAARIYRAAGQEVLMLATGIPAGATASDLEVSFQSLGATVPESVALVDTAEGLFQGDAALSLRIVTVLKGKGLGLMTYDRGLNRADQIAERQALPVARIFRGIDDSDENTATIVRYLDRAAFKAAQEGQVSVIGRTRPETIEALREWRTTVRAESVILAPATAAMHALQDQ